MLNDIDALMIKYSSIFDTNVHKSSNKGASSEQIKEIMKKTIPEKDLKKILEDLNEIINSSLTINKRVQLSFNEEINRVIITVLDNETGKTIVEIPCEEIQKLAVHLKEASGILYDKKV
ncbi:MAG: hypothetical protein A2086_13345 [Spirochaetes bacterium GWD1_27_9]|nr:MAG: hypothetical protein A2Z98_13495 [Spirochaetes bacterium GWB1_27_13]OHD25579.1 MAG: hypothetical protein A2Y34_06915 [Spirochaetes bacterium GWC1_27_15]OHD45924.1 MAG: hypothetical protein A2086_13345 [Spirochaetes bacterium GWD1_27_9]